MGKNWQFIIETKDYVISVRKKLISIIQIFTIKSLGQMVDQLL